jgi:hypothetical protein
VQIGVDGPGDYQVRTLDRWRCQMVGRALVERFDGCGEARFTIQRGDETAVRIGSPAAEWRPSARRRPDPTASRLQYAPSQQNKPFSDKE